jgi:hypothetical protein
MFDTRFNAIRGVDPGQNDTWEFLAFYRWGFGTLGGCMNESLNGLGVQYGGPYLTMDENNSTVIAGTWNRSIHSITEDGKNGARRLGLAGQMRR